MGYVQQNTALEISVQPHVQPPQVSVGRTSGSLPSRVHGSHRRPRLAAFETKCVIRGMHEVICCRPRERDALSGAVTEPGAFFRLVP